jgi:hypothetical protein
MSPAPYAWWLSAGDRCEHALPLAETATGDEPTPTALCGHSAPRAEWSNQPGQRCQECDRAVGTARPRSAQHALRRDDSNRLTVKELLDGQRPYGRHALDETPQPPAGAGAPDPAPAGPQPATGAETVPTSRSASVAPHSAG